MQLRFPTTLHATDLVLSGPILPPSPSLPVCRPPMSPPPPLRYKNRPNYWSCVPTNYWSCVPTFCFTSFFLLIASMSSWSRFSSRKKKTCLPTRGPIQTMRQSEKRKKPNLRPFFRSCFSVPQAKALVAPTFFFFLVLVCRPSSAAGCARERDEDYYYENTKENPPRPSTPSPTHPPVSYCRWLLLCHAAAF